MTPSTLLHLIDTGGPGGAETVFLDLVRGMSRERWRSIPVVPEEDWLDAALRRLGECPVLLESSGSFDRRYLGGLRRLFRERRPAIVQTHLFTSAVYATLASVGLGIPVVSTLHGVPDIDPGDPLLRVKLRIVSGRRNRLVFVSESLRGHVLALGPILRERTVVIHNGVDCLEFSPPPDLSRRDRGPGGEAGPGPPPGARVVGAVGNIRPSKDYATLLRATRLLLDSGEDLHVVIVGQGQGQLLRELLDLSGELALTERVHFAGFREDVPAAMRSFDVFALSSSDEGFSLATVQAMASGLPVVATRSGGPEEIVLDGETGYLVEPRDPAALAAGIARVLNREDRGRGLAEAGRARARDHFSRDAMVRAYEELYREVLGDFRGREASA